MKDASIRCALWLRKQKIGAKDVVSFCGNDRIDAYIPLLASVYVGSIFNAWDYQVTLREYSAKQLISLTKTRKVQYFFCFSARASFHGSDQTKNHVHHRKCSRSSDGSSEIGECGCYIRCVGQIV